jgi:hypothetical protein
LTNVSPTAMNAPTSAARMHMTNVTLISAILLEFLYSQAGLRTKGICNAKRLGCGVSWFDAFVPN